MLALPLLFLAQAAPVPIEPGALPRAIAEAKRGAAPAQCTAAAGDEITVCSRPRNTFRVDPVVLAIERAAEAGPPRRPLDASTTVAGSKCIGPRKCGDAVLPLVQVALATLRAATLAAKGEDWKDAFRNGPTQYRRYQDEQAGAKATPKVRVSLGAKP